MLSSVSPLVCPLESPNIRIFYRLTIVANAPSSEELLFTVDQSIVDLFVASRSPFKEWDYINAYS